MEVTSNMVQLAGCIVDARIRLHGGRLEICHNCTAPPIAGVAIATDQPWLPHPAGVGLVGLVELGGLGGLGGPVGLVGERPDRPEAVREGAQTVRISPEGVIGLHDIGFYQDLRILLRLLRKTTESPRVLGIRHPS